MRIPKFVPLEESGRRSREWAGLAIQIIMWGYIFVILGRVVYGQVLLPYIEDLAFEEPAVQWAKHYIESNQLDSRYFEMAWSTIGLIFAFGAGLGLLIGFTGRGFGAWVASISKLQVTNPEDSIRIQKHWSYARKEGAFLLFMTLVAAWLVTKIDLGKLFEAEGLAGAGRLFLQLACGIPGVGENQISIGGHVFNWGASLFDFLRWGLNVIVSGVNSIRSVFGYDGLEHFTLTCVPTEAAYYTNALSKLAESVYLAFIATFFAVPIAFVVSFFAARNLTRHSAVTRAIYVILRTYMNVSRSIEPMIWAILFSVWIGIGPFAGSIALMVHSVASLVKQYSEAVESVDEGPIEALQATGANRIATAWFAVVPQVVLPYLAFTIYRWDINVRMATVIGLVGGGGIGGLIVQEQGLAHWTQVGTIAFLIFIVVWTMDFLSARVREAIQ